MAVPAAVLDFIEVPFSINGAWIAKNNLDGTFGTPVGLFAKEANLDIKTISDEAPGNTKIVATASEIIKIDWTLGTVGIQFPALRVLYAGLNAASSPTFTDQPMSNLVAQYFGLILEALAENGSALRILIPKNKVMQGFSWKFSYGKLIVPDFKGSGIEDEVLGYILDPREYPDKTTAINFPPSW